MNIYDKNKASRRGFLGTLFGAVVIAPFLPAIAMGLL